MKIHYAGPALALLLATACPSTAATYDLSKGLNRPGQALKPMIIKPSKVHTDFSANWTWRLDGVAMDSKSPIDTVTEGATVMALVGQGGVPIATDKTAATAWAEAFQDSHASFAAIKDVLGDLQHYEAVVRVNGHALTNIKGGKKGDWAFALASSTSKLEIFGVAAGTGKLEVKPFKRLNLKGCTNAIEGGGFVIPEPWNTANKACKSGDPIIVEAINQVDGSTASGTLFSFDMEGLTNIGIMSFEDGLLSIDALSGRFTLDIPGLYTLQSGSIVFEFENGIVTRSDLTGQFAGLLPGVGMSALGSWSLGPMALDYDFGWGDDAYSLAIDAGVFDQVSAFQMVPEPASWAMMISGFGLVGATLRRRRGLAA